MRPIEPTFWGQSAWYILHRMSYHFKDIITAKMFYYTLPEILPCGKCRRNIVDVLKLTPFPKNIKDISKWIIKIHNKVNDALGKSIFREKSDKNNYDINIEYEMIFIKSLIATHPGCKEISVEYEEALYIFLSNWFDSIKEINDNIKLDKTKIKSRCAMKKFIKSLGDNCKKLEYCDTTSCRI